MSFPKNLLSACFEIIFDPVPSGGPSREGGIVAAVLRQTDATKRVPPFLKHALREVAAESRAQCKAGTLRA